MDSQNVDTRSRKEKYANKDKKKTSKPKNKKKTNKGLFIFLLIILALVCLILGAVMGYSIVGDGSPADVFKWSTWSKLFQLIFG